MTGAEAAGSGNLVIDDCMIAGKACCVLYDSGATHSFVLDACVKHLGLLVCELQCELVVSTLASGLVRTSSLCARCPMEVEGRKYKANLGDGLALCQSHSYKLQREEVAFPQLRGA